MTLLEFVKQKRGRIKEIAQAINIKPIAISRWALGQRQVPAERCPDIEQATGRAVTCEEMRPDINWAILRQSAKKTK